MAQTAMEDLLKRCGSVYKLVILAAKRAKEIAEGAPPLVQSDKKKVTSIALEEIRQGKVLYKSEDAKGSDGEGKPKSRAKTREKKRAVA